jgi:hypothetical protein
MYSMYGRRSTFVKKVLFSCSKTCSIKLVCRLIYATDKYDTVQLCIQIAVLACLDTIDNLS